MTPSSDTWDEEVPESEDDASGAEQEAAARESHPEVRRLVDAARALPEGEQELLLVEIIDGLHVGDSIPDLELERLWSALVGLKLRRAARRARANPVPGNPDDAGLPEATARSFRGEDLRFEFGSTRYPLAVDGTVDGLPFLLTEEGESWRFAVSPDASVDPRTVTSNRAGFLVTGRVGHRRARGGDEELSREQVAGLIDVCIEVLRARSRQRAPRPDPEASEPSSDKGDREGMIEIR